MVSPGSGKRGVTETMSALREPITRMMGAMVDFKCCGWEMCVGVLGCWTSSGES